MLWKRSCIALGLATALLPLSVARAADHQDGASVLTDPSTDLNDVYAWTSPDGTKIYLIMTLYPATNKTTSKFSNAAYYVFHTSSRPTFASPNVALLDVICSFDAAQIASCWVGSSAFVTGSATNPAGISSTDGKLKLFAGPRKDHFFFNLQGFNDARTNVASISPPFTVDSNGCAAASAMNPGGLTTSQSAIIDTAFAKTGSGTMPPVDFFASFNTLAIVMAIDKTLLNSGGPILGVWAATHKKM
mgnify:CR=1 FL=1